MSLPMASTILCMCVSVCNVPWWLSVFVFHFNYDYVSLELPMANTAVHSMCFTSHGKYDCVCLKHPTTE